MREAQGERRRQRNRERESESERSIDLTKKTNNGKEDTCRPTLYKEIIQNRVTCKDIEQWAKETNVAAGRQEEETDRHTDKGTQTKTHTYKDTQRY